MGFFEKWRSDKERPKSWKEIDDEETIRDDDEQDGSGDGGDVMSREFDPGPTPKFLRKGESGDESRES